MVNGFLKKIVRKKMAKLALFGRKKTIQNSLPPYKLIKKGSLFKPFLLKNLNEK